ncbi:L,D-transpeptidase family protein [Alteromonas sp. ASW11-19]|uniref:L,D-transpeptidase family protein n=1 Tax=Alteromonas salexigens TaxID=2982530 RepID=A0ABT2VLS7_9ALTE|nr:L,D-transpeptidase family protein [Alteromonas salexigens]MCU7553808.1 L,D-transpeptidase family protein [Alteromonas salexigens]
MKSKTAERVIGSLDAVNQKPHGNKGRGLRKALSALLVCGAVIGQVSATPAITQGRWSTVQTSTDNFPSLDRRLERMQSARDIYAIAMENGGWDTIDREKLLREGATGPDVYAVVERLRVEYPQLENVCVQHPAMQNNVKEDCTYTEEVADAVRDFQDRHGLQVDGVVGSSTTDALNVSARQRYQQLTLNIERLQAFKPKIEESYVLVNIPEYALRYVKSGKVAFNKDVVVGKPSWKTPSFSDSIEKFVVNPEWRIPLSIATREIAPKAADNPDYFEENNIVIRKDSYVDDELIDPKSIDWEDVEPYEFDHFMVKLPHEKNPLGEVKYLFPNSHAVYVHDTPFEQWFKEPQRAASHGCIRLEDPFSLAEIIAEEQEVTRMLEDVHRARVREEPKTFHLENPLPIHLVYWTAWADEKGRINFREDIYNRDEEALEQLAAR